jgi:hypothetical protein
MAVVNRKNATGKDVLYFVCRTYQRFTKAGICTCHTIKEKAVTEAVIDKVKEICAFGLTSEIMEPIALSAVEEARKTDSSIQEIQSLQEKIENINANLDKIYLDHLNGLLAATDFERIYHKIQTDRTALENRLINIEAIKTKIINSNDKANELVSGFKESAFASREMLVSLIERIELTADKEIIIRFRFRQPEAII